MNPAKHRALTLGVLDSVERTTKSTGKWRRSTKEFTFGQAVVAAVITWASLGLAALFY